MRSAVDVVIVTNKEGLMRPLIIIWEEYGVKTKHWIKRIVQKPPCLEGMLYDCFCEGQLMRLYYKQGCWQIEKI